MAIGSFPGAVVCSGCHRIAAHMSFALWPFDCSKPCQTLVLLRSLEALVANMMLGIRPVLLAASPPSTAKIHRRFGIHRAKDSRHRPNLAENWKHSVQSGLSAVELRAQIWQFRLNLAKLGRQRSNLGAISTKSGASSTKRDSDKNWPKLGQTRSDFDLVCPKFSQVCGESAHAAVTVFSRELRRWAQRFTAPAHPR